MNKIPSQIILEFINNPRFVTVLDLCLEEEDLIEQFERLYGIKRPAERQHPLERMVDEVTGFRNSQWSDFSKRSSRLFTIAYGFDGKSATMKGAGNDQ